TAEEEEEQVIGLDDMLKMTRESAAAPRDYVSEDVQESVTPPAAKPEETAEDDPLFSLDRTERDDTELSDSTFEAVPEKADSQWPPKIKLMGWYVRMQSGGHLDAHMHELGWVSGTLYLSLPENVSHDEGKIELGLHGNNYPLMHENFPTKTLPIKTGDIVLFPSSTFHRTIPFRASNVVEKFSSDGPRRVFFYPNGNAITPGNYSATGGVLRQKPDIAAADGVQTATPGFNPFYGTSAAAPHAAAIGALLRSGKPDITIAEVRDIFNSTAIDIEGAGYDRDSGAGIIMADAVLKAAGIHNVVIPPLIYLLQ
ncbi:MAG: hypothetical protein DSY58_04820, partial [Desulfobulbus sp.]